MPPRRADATTAPTYSLPEHLVERLRARKVVPFVGAGVSRAVCESGMTSALFPNWSELLRRAAEQLRKEHEPHDATTVERALDERDYLEAAPEGRLRAHDPAERMAAVIRLSRRLFATKPSSSTMPSDETRHFPTASSAPGVEFLVVGAPGSDGRRR